MKQIKISNDEFMSLIQTVETEKEMSMEMFWDHVEMLKDTENPNEVFQWIELSIFNYNLYDKLHKIFTETTTNENDKILKIKEK
jgi:hypothetical protein